MKPKRHTPVQVVSKPRDAEAMLAKGATHVRNRVWLLPSLVANPSQKVVQQTGAALPPSRECCTLNVVKRVDATTASCQEALVARRSESAECFAGSDRFNTQCGSID